MSKSDLKSLKAEHKKINEETSGAVGDGKLDGASGAPEGGGPEANKGFKGGKSAGSISKDDHSAPVKPVARGNGVQDSGIKAFAPEKTEMKGAGKTSQGGTVKAVTRDSGAAAGVKEVGKGDKEGNKAAVDKAETVKRDEGAGGGAKEVGEYGDLTKFRSKVRGAFGLSMDDKLNKGNDGLNKK